MCYYGDKKLQEDLNWIRLDWFEDMANENATARYDYLLGKIILSVRSNQDLYSLLNVETGMQNIIKFNLKSS